VHPAFAPQRYQSGSLQQAFHPNCSSTAPDARPAASRESGARLGGHFVCYLNRTYHVLTTPGFLGLLRNPDIV
jgi:hypothetical protein